MRIITIYDQCVQAQQEIYKRRRKNRKRELEVIREILFCHCSSRIAMAPSAQFTFFLYVRFCDFSIVMYLVCFFNCDVAKNCVVMIVKTHNFLCICQFFGLLTCKFVHFLAVFIEVSQYNSGFYLHLKMIFKKWR